MAQATWSEICFYKHSIWVLKPAIYSFTSSKTQTASRVLYYITGQFSTKLYSDAIEDSANIFRMFSSLFFLFLSFWINIWSEKKEKELLPSVISWKSLFKSTSLQISSGRYLFSSPFCHLELCFFFLFFFSKIFGKKWYSVLNKR